jgi:acetolactate synthase-1/2/3 large subunit
LRLSLGSLLAETLKRLGVKYIYGIIGTSVVDFYDVLREYKDINVVTVRHEQVAVSAADAIYRTTRNLAAAVVHAGPGFLNSLIGLGIAMKDRVPLILISGGVRRRLRGTDSWLEVDQKSISDGLVKSYKVIEDPREAPDLIVEAIRSMFEPPMGPVALEVCEDIWNSEIDVSNDYFLKISSLKPPKDRAEEKDVKEAVELLREAKRPLILASGELAYSPYFDQEKLLRIAESLGAYVVTSGNGRGACPEDNPRCLGRVGFGGGSIVSDRAFEKTDALVVLGNEFDDITTYAYTNLPEGDILVFSLDPSAKARPKYYDLIEANPVAVLEKMYDIVRNLGVKKKSNEWDSLIRSWRAEWNSILRSSAEKKTKFVNPSRFFSKLNGILPRERIVSAGQGTHIVYTYDYIEIYRPGSFLAATNLGAMGYALPAALGASHANPNAETVAVVGDGEIMMTIQDLETVKRTNANLKVIVVNDYSYRVLYLRQVLQKGGRVFQTLLGNPDFKMLAESMGIKAFRAESDEDADKAIEFLKGRGPLLVEVVIDKDEIPPLNMEYTLKMSSA